MKHSRMIAEVDVVTTEELTAAPFGARLRTLRKAHPLTQAELAELVGSTQHEVSRWEKGVVRPRPVMVRRMCAALGVEPAALLGRTEESI